MDHILFLRLKMDEHHVTLLSSSVRPGRLKTPPIDPSAAGLLLELSGRDGRFLWSSVVPDLTILRLESRSPERPDELQTWEKRFREAEWTVRVPLHPQATQMKVYRWGGLFRRLEGRNQEEVNELVGTIQLPFQRLPPRPLPESDPGSTVPTLLLTNGPNSQRINIAFLAEGYVAEQMDQFIMDSGRLLTRLLGTPPLNDYSNHFNAFAIFVASAEAGSDHPSRDVFKDTYFNSSFDSYGTSWLVTIPPNDHDPSAANGRARVDALLQSRLPDYDLSMLVVNDPEYGGSGGSPLIVALNTSAAEIVVHEFGHTFARLGDEYSTPYPDYPDVEQPNTTSQTNPDLIKWRDWILPDTPIPTPPIAAFASVIGLFEGAHYHSNGWFRPKLDCKMNHLGVSWCEVCAETIVKSIYGLVRPVDSYFPATNDLVYVNSSGLVTFQVKTAEPVTHALKIQWFLNGVVLGGETASTLSLAAQSLLSPGITEVSVEVADPTPLVRTDPQQLLKQTIAWRVVAQPGPQLLAKLMGQNVTLSWPASAADFTLESSLELGSGNGWSAEPAVPDMVNGNFVAKYDLTGAAKFFRLRRASSPAQDQAISFD